MISPFYPASSSAGYLAQIPPDVLQRALDYTHGGHWILLFSAMIGVAINVLVLRSGLLTRVRERRERRGARPWSVSLAVFAAYYLLIWVLDLPWALYAHWWRETAYGLSRQGAGAWLAESLISAAFSCLLLALVVTLLYALMRRAPRSWWLWSSLVTAVVIVFAMVIVPVTIEPAFNHFTPLAAGRHRAAIETLAAQAGIDAAHIDAYDGSRQSGNYTAHVSGMFGTARIAVSDALLNQAGEAELRAVVAHEIGHYVLHHGLWMALGYSLLLTFAFWVTHRLYAPLSAWLGDGGGKLGGLADPAGLPLLSMIVTVCFLLLTPVTNAMVRTIENQADAWSLATAREPDGMAIALLRTVDYRAPDPGLVEEWLFYDHPSIARRIGCAMAWKAGHPRDGK